MALSWYLGVAHHLWVLPTICDYVWKLQLINYQSAFVVPQLPPSSTSAICWTPHPYTGFVSQCRQTLRTTDAGKRTMEIFSAANRAQPIYQFTNIICTNNHYSINRVEKGNLMFIWTLAAILTMPFMSQCNKATFKAYIFDNCSFDMQFMIFHCGKIVNNYFPSVKQYICRYIGIVKFCPPKMLIEIRPQKTSVVLYSQ